MNSFGYFHNISCDHLSVEANSDGFLLPINQYESTFETELGSLFDCDMFTSGFNIAGVCESADLVGKIRWILIKINFYIQNQ